MNDSIHLSEYAIALLGSIEAALVVTTVNPWHTAEEISKQLISSRPKAIFTLIENADVVKEACSLAQQPDIRIIIIKSGPYQTICLDSINFNELINTSGMFSQLTEKNHSIVL